MVRYLALVKGKWGHPLDFYPEERTRYISECVKMGEKILGEFDTREEAYAAIDNWFKTENVK